MGIEVYEFINKKICAMYKEHGITYNDEFINYIWRNELENTPWEDQLTKSPRTSNVGYCVLLDFDEDHMFPIPNGTLDRDEYILQKLKEIVWDFTAKTGFPDRFSIS